MASEEFTGFSSTYIYVRGRQLEGTYSDDPSIGMWGISGCRIARGWGIAPRHLLPVPIEWPPVEPPGLDAAAKKNRILLYQRVRSANEAIQSLAEHGAVSSSFEITEQWFDAADGMITIPKHGDEFIGSHAITLVDFDRQKNAFRFANSWGTEWGDTGFGYLPFDCFEPYFLEAWVVRGIRDHIPVEPVDSAQLIEGGLPDALSDGLIHLVEMYDPRYDERMGWAFALERDDYLDIEELFVKPQYRNNGIGRYLANSLVKRGRVLGRPLRLWISHADASNINTIPFQSTLRTLGLNFVRKRPNRWANCVATAGDEI